MPTAKAPSAPWVEVWLSPQTTVLPGLGVAEIGPDYVDDALQGAEPVIEGYAEFLAVAGQSF